MGRGTVLIAVAGLLAAASIAYIGQRSRFEMNQEENRYGRQVVAREVALSGLQRGLSTVKLDLMDAPEWLGDRPVSGGTYDVAITDNLYGDLTVVSRGTVGDMRHEIESNVIFETPLDAALVLAANSVRVDSSGTYMISGVDARSPSIATGPGFLKAAKAVMTDGAINQSVIESSISSESLQGDGGSGSVGQGADIAKLEQIYAEAVLRPDKVVPMSPYVGTYGSPDAPAVVHVTGDFQPSGVFSGYGVLVIENGDFLVSDGFSWEGLVLVRKSVPSDIEVSLTGDAVVYGGIAAFEPPSGASSVSCTDVPFTIDGIETVPDVPFQLRTDVIGTAISYGGSYDMPVTARLHTGDLDSDPWGSFDSALSGNVNKDGTFFYEPNEPLAAGTGVTLSGSSWKRDSGDGTQESDWTRHMAQNSETGGSQLMVLRDGDPVPDISGYLDQGSVADFVDAFIDPVTNRITLDQNQSIYLFELGTTNSTSAAYDFQDLVVLVSLLRSDAGCSFGGAGGDEISFSMSGASQIRYSGEAVAKIGAKLAGIESAARVVVASQRDVLVTPEESGAVSVAAD